MQQKVYWNFQQARTLTDAYKLKELLTQIMKHRALIGLVCLVDFFLLYYVFAQGNSIWNDIHHLDVMAALVNGGKSLMFTAPILALEIIAIHRMRKVKYLVILPLCLLVLFSLGMLLSVTTVNHSRPNPQDTNGVDPKKWITSELGFGGESSAGKDLQEAKNTLAARITQDAYTIAFLLCSGIFVLSGFVVAAQMDKMEEVRGRIRKVRMAEGLLSEWKRYETLNSAYGSIQAELRNLENPYSVMAAIKDTEGDVKGIFLTGLRCYKTKLAEIENYLVTRSMLNQTETLDRLLTAVHRDQLKKMTDIILINLDAVKRRIAECETSLEAVRMTRIEDIEPYFEAILHKPRKVEEEKPCLKLLPLPLECC